MSTSIAFIDVSYPRPYGLDDIGFAPLGGTELTLLRIAKELSYIHDVTVYQKERLVSFFDDHLTYVPASVILNGDATPEIIIVINSWKVACRLRKTYPQTPIVVWLHIFPGKHNKRMGKMLAEAHISLVAVSKSHASSLMLMFDETSNTKVVVDMIYNPIADNLETNGARRDLNLLLYASSPHKGLNEVFQQFDHVRKTIPSLHLEIANPGYLQWPLAKIPDNVKFIGRLDHEALTERMSQSLCLFYPQTSFSETFGLVIAECLAVGTPVIIHKGLGANDEIAGYTECLVDGDNYDSITDRVQSFRNKIPDVYANPHFRMSSVIQSWHKLLAQKTQEQLSDTSKKDDYVTNVLAQSLHDRVQAQIFNDQMSIDLRKNAILEETGQIPISGSVKLLDDNGFLRTDFAIKDAGRLGRLLMKIAENNLPLARLYEGHANALLLAKRHLRPDEFAQVSAKCNVGELYGVWGADGRIPVIIDENQQCLRGEKQFASGLGTLSSALVTVKCSDNSTRLFLVPVTDEQRMDRSSWTMTGMIATSSGTYNFDGVLLRDITAVGKKGVYEQEPYFVGGIWRIAAIQLGGIFGLLGSVIRALASRGQTGSIEHNMRLIPILSRAKAAKGLVFSVAALENNDSESSVVDPEYIVANAILCRLLTEEIALEAIQAAEQCVGLTHFEKASESGRIARDLAVYCRQAARDAMLQRAAAKLLHDNCDLSDIF